MSCNKMDEPLDFLSTSSGYDQGFFECYKDPTTCCFSWCCGPCMVGHVKGVLDDQQHHDDHAEDPNTPLLSHSSFSILSCVCSFLGAYRNRKYIQARYNIKESDDGSTLAIGCLPCCAISQDAHEIMLRKKNGTLQGGPARVASRAMTTAPKAAEAPMASDGAKPAQANVGPSTTADSSASNPPPDSIGSNTNPTAK